MHSASRIHRLTSNINATTNQLYITCYGQHLQESFCISTWAPTKLSRGDTNMRQKSHHWSYLFDPALLESLASFPSFVPVLIAIGMDGITGGLGPPL